MGIFDNVFAKRDCLACGGTGSIGPHRYYSCMTCGGLGYNYGSAPAGPNDDYPDNLKLCGNSEGIQWHCPCGSDESLYVSHEGYEYSDDLKCEECGKVYTYEKTIRVEISVTLDGKTVAEGTY